MTGWADSAGCRGLAWWDIPAAQAVIICGRCPVRDRCHQEAEALDAHGVWGGVERVARRDGRHRYRCPRCGRIQIHQTMADRWRICARCETAGERAAFIARFRRGK